MDASQMIASVAESLSESPDSILKRIESPSFGTLESWDWEFWVPFNLSGEWQNLSLETRAAVYQLCDRFARESQYD